MGIEDGSTLRWTKARERNRLKARYLIRASVISRVVSVDTDDTDDDCHNAAQQNEAANGAGDGDGAYHCQITAFEDEDCGNNAIHSLKSPHRSDRVNNGSCSSISNNTRHCNNYDYQNKHSLIKQHDQIIDNNDHIRTNEFSILRQYLERIIQNDVSSFSVAALAKHGRLLERLSCLLLPTAAAAEEAVSTSINSTASITDTANHRTTTSSNVDYSNNQRHLLLMEMMSTILPWEMVSHQSQQQQHQPRSLQPITLATSKYGRNYVTHRLVPYMQRIMMIPTQRHQQQQQRRRTRRRTLTILEYASLLGRHDIVSMLLLGGLDPTFLPEAEGGEENVTTSSSSSSSNEASRSVLALLHNVPIGTTNGYERYNDDDGGVDDDEEGGGEGVEECGGSSRIPLSMWAYIVRAVIDMRINGTLEDGHPYREEDSASITNTIRDGDDETRRYYCSLCKNNFNNNNHHHQYVETLVFGPPCYHSFCEQCMWKHLVKHVPNCTNLNSNVVTCPICDEEFRGLNMMCHEEERGDDVILANASSERMEGKNNCVENYSLSAKDVSFGTEKTEGALDDSNSCHDRHQERLQQLRCNESLSKFLKLPATCTELKLSNKAKKKKKRRDHAHGTWGEALRASISTYQSQSVRSDRFFKAVLSSPQLVVAYLDAGVHVNMQNLYGQTPLYLACWKGSISVVRSLLDYGANADIGANGGSSCYSIAKKCRRTEVLHLLAENDRMKKGGNIPTACEDMQTRTKEPSALSRNNGKCRVSVLIDPAVDHPGAGACIVDDALSDEELKRLEDLWKSLPESNTSSEEAINVKHHPVSSSSTSINKSAYRPSRYYFCDAEEWVQTMLIECVDAARIALLATKETTLKDESDPDVLSSGSGRRPSPPASIFQHIRFLNYERPGGILPPHVDLCRVDSASGFRSTHTFILYLTDCGEGGGTALLQQLNDPRVISVVQPKRGRVLIFPHMCPHSGLEVIRAPKLLLRGEIILDSS